MHVQKIDFEILKNILHISVEFSNNSMINFYVQKGTFQILRIRKQIIITIRGPEKQLNNVLLLNVCNVKRMCVRACVCVSLSLSL